jgi:hypothetical protein
MYMENYIRPNFQCFLRQVLKIRFIHECFQLFLFSCASRALFPSLAAFSVSKGSFMTVLVLLKQHTEEQTEFYCHRCDQRVVRQHLNTVQHVTIDEAVFSLSSAQSKSKNEVLCGQLLGYTTVFTTGLCFLCGPYRGYIMRIPG